MITSESLAGSSYEGWVAWIKDPAVSGLIPIFESVPYNPNLLPIISGGKQYTYRKESKNWKDWKDVPLNLVQRLELYFNRNKFPNQPVARFDREPGYDDVLFFQMKMGGLVIPTDRNATVSRTGIYGYKIGYWDKRRNLSEMYEIDINGRIIRHQSVKNPCLPKPEGYGLNSKLFEQK